MSRTPEPLGRVVGRLLDRSALPEPGAAAVARTGPDGSEECRVHWRTASVWRVQTRRSLSASDGTTTWGADPDHPRPAGLAAVASAARLPAPRAGLGAAE